MLALLLAACSVDPPGAASGPEVAVVGGGLAGMSAAIELAMCARVTLFEGRSELGGSATLGDAVTAVPSASALAALDRAWGSNPARTRFVDRVGPDVVDWLRAGGVRWRELPEREPDGTTLWEPLGGGPAVVEALAAKLRTPGAGSLPPVVQLGARVTRLGRGPGGIRVEVGATAATFAAVVLATGGFAGNVERVREVMNLGEAPLLRGAAPFADGNGLALGAGLGGVERTPGRVLLYAHGTPAPDDPGRALMLVDGAHVYPVDTRGAYVPAAQTPRGVSGDVLRGLPGATAWAILDQKALDHIPLWDGDHHAPAAMTPAVLASGHLTHSLAELSASLGIPEPVLRAGVVARNSDATPAHPLLANSSRWGALPLRLTTAKSLTGLEVDLDGHLLDARGAPVPGVYAAGELAGFAHPWEADPIDSTMASGAVLTGRAAGRGACSDLARATTGG